MSIQNKNNYAIILCGGSGTRLWPLSRKSKPKQFLSFDNKSVSLIQKTIERVCRIFKKQNIFIVTNKDFYFELLSQLSSEYKDIIPNIITEPEAKNTLPAISFAVMEIYKKSKFAKVGVFPADHEIKNMSDFKTSWIEALKATDLKSIIIFGIRPSCPNIGYGYIKLGSKLNSKGLHKVEKFIEKPSLVKAKKFIQDGYLWNSGMFAFQLEYFISSLEKFYPKIYSIFFNSSVVDINLSYKKLPNISIDKGLIEKLNECFVIKSNISWTDLGTWNSVHNYSKKNNNSQTTVTIGDVIAVDSNNSLVISDNKLTTVFGIDNLIVVNTDDALLVSSKDKADSLKELIDKVMIKHSNKINYHPLVIRPWGYYKILYESEVFKIKAITVFPGMRLSMQLHYYRNEHWVVLRGIATVIKNREKFKLKVNESTYIKAKEKHRLSNDGSCDLEIIEVSLGSKVLEEDIVRFDDDYGRVKN